MDSPEKQQGEATTRNLRVCIYGGTNLEKKHQEFLSALAYKILDSMDAVIITGGFHSSNANPEAVSTDVAALDGARRSRS
jgi:hypothetical protein